MSVQILYNDGDSQHHNLQIPDKCPLCHHAIDPIIHFGFCDKEKWQSSQCLQVIYRCTRKVCKNLFIAYYRALSPTCNLFSFSHLKPIEKESRVFTNTVNEISPNFCMIYNQALIAEQDGLTEICGVGYRKAIEFLVKDYLIKKKPGEELEIKNKKLVQCIEKDIANDNIKRMSKRATWLGNDETHYLRKWEGKDVTDLKNLIDATLYWIEMEKLSEDVETDMPEDE